MQVEHRRSATMWLVAVLALLMSGFSLWLHFNDQGWWEKLGVSPRPFVSIGDETAAAGVAHEYISRLLEGPVDPQFRDTLIVYDERSQQWMTAGTVQIVPHTARPGMTLHSMYWQAIVFTDGDNNWKLRFADVRDTPSKDRRKAVYLNALTPPGSGTSINRSSFNMFVVEPMERLEARVTESGE